MQALPTAAAMAAQTILFSAARASPLLPPPSTRPFHSTFAGQPLRVPSSASFMLAAAPAKPLAVVATAKKAVAVLKGSSQSQVEGVVTLVQEDDGLSPPLYFFFFLALLGGYILTCFCGNVLGVFYFHGLSPLFSVVTHVWTRICGSFVEIEHPEAMVFEFYDVWIVSFPVFGWFFEFYMIGIYFAFLSVLLAIFLIVG